jgi:hypothetical protein
LNAKEIHRLGPMVSLERNLRQLTKSRDFHQNYLCDYHLWNTGANQTTVENETQILKKNALTANRKGTKQKEKRAAVRGRLMNLFLSMPVRERMGGRG